MNFIFTNLSMIVLVAWLIFFCVVVMRVLKPTVVKNISYGWFVIIAVMIHLLYGIVATWGQYLAWMLSDITRALLLAPLSPEVPFPIYLEWARTLFEKTHGYFAFFSFQSFFLSTIALLIIVGLFLLFLIVRSRTNPINFKEGDIMLIVLAMLISGWPGVVVLLPIGFICAVLLSIGARIAYGIERVTLPPAFLLASPIALLLAIPILTALNLYPLLKL